ncbi:MAG TPA: YhhA family cyclophane-containing RiPP [Allosphingosinicella sp.]|jgi:hypothetical protein|nr:YhhA family cyclophane-containing RiPP [Allosphingosinicella sp.]
MDAQLDMADLPLEMGAIDAALDSPALARLIEEVRSTDFEVTRAYNRTYNRHNR